MALSINDAGFSDALVVLGAAGLVIPAFARLRVNPVIGFILTGLLVGPHGLGALTDRLPWLYYFTISNPHAIEPFAEFGIILLLFSIGLELSFRRLWSMRRQVFGLGAIELLGSALLIAIGLAALGQGIPGAVGMGLALALSSTALVLPLAGTTSPTGRIAFAMLLFEDLALVPIIFLLGALGPQASGEGVAGLFGTLGIGIATVLALFLAGRVVLPRLFSQAARTKSPELFLSASLLVVMLASIATTAAGLSPIVGALLAGLLIAETEYHAEVEVITAPFKGLALGVFLITVGMSIDLAQIASNWASLIPAVVGVMLAKVAVTAGLLRFSGIGRGVAAETGLSMASPSETTLIVLAAAVQAQLILPATAAFWQTVTAIGLTLTPLLIRVGRDVARGFARSSMADEPEVPVGEHRAVVVGYGRVGRLVAQMLERHEIPFLAVDADPDAVARARADGLPILFGDVTRPAFLERLALDRIDALILTMDSPVELARTTARVRAIHPELAIVSRARDARHAAELYRSGATDAVPETLESSLQLSEAVLVGLGIAMGPVIASIHEKRSALREEIMSLAETTREPPIRRRRLRDAAPANPAPGPR